MPSFAKTVGAAVAGLAAFASALPSHPRLTRSQMKIHDYMKRQEAAAAASGLTDVDILQFALTLEWLEATFYQQGFAMFPASDFEALGLTQEQITDLTSIGTTEQAHVQLLQSSIAQAGVQPVQPCTYNFGFTDAAGMVATAAILENVGVSAYLGGGPLVSDKSILGTAASILTIEARHQTFVRTASAAVAVPQPFDTALSPAQVFSLAAPFIESCPEGSNLALSAFPTLTAAGGAAASGVGALEAGSMLQLESEAAAQASFCAFTSGGIPGGTAFAAFDAASGCQVPQNLAGFVYVNLVSDAPPTGVISDDIILAGPMAMQAS